MRSWRSSPEYAFTFTHMPYQHDFLDLCLVEVAVPERLIAFQKQIDASTLAEALERRVVDTEELDHD